MAGPKIIIPSINKYKLKHCIYSPLAIANNINNYPGSDFNSSLGPNRADPNLQRGYIIENLHKLFDNCINKILLRFKGLIGLSSVYRNRRLNELVGGVPNSQHIYGYAADIVPLGDNTTADIFNYCVKYLPLYHQLIWEYPEKGPYSPNSKEFSWIHISYIDGNNYKENSVSSFNQKIHKFYENENTFTIGNFTHRIKEADTNLISDLEL
ncbi:putative peptidase [uncultured virus]|uniref:Putative peptidase n=1 Tax=uncultured virus TaxID=340016 RepID=A0A218MMN6_9VIRU|nr:putative peptidase [uncultured virus]